MPSFDYYREALAQKGVHTSFDLCQFLLDRCQVAVLPGSDFYLPPERLVVRVAAVDYDGVEVLEAFRKQKPSIQNNDFIEKHCTNLFHAMNRIQSVFIDLQGERI